MATSVEEQLRKYREEKASRHKQSKSKSTLKEYVNYAANNLFFWNSESGGDSANTCTSPVAGAAAGNTHFQRTFTATDATDAHTGEHLLANTRNIQDYSNCFKERRFYLQPKLWMTVLWFLLWGLFIELGFGAVYFCISLLIIVYYSMKPSSRKQGELSAYSVFNPNCERLEGTFTAEQFEKELRFGPGSVH